MITLLTCTDPSKLSEYPENTRLLQYREDERDAGHIAIIPYKSSMEILSLSVSSKIGDNPADLRHMTAKELAALDTMLRAAGAIALDNGIFSLCSKKEELTDILVSYGFSHRGGFVVMYLSELFKPCSACGGDNQGLGGTPPSQGR